MVRRPLTIAVLVVALAAGALTRPAAAADVRSQEVADRAVAWLAGQQQPDGGFEVAGFPGFETPDAVLAIAGAAQRTTRYDRGRALAAVRAVRRGGHDPLHALDDLADGEPDAGKAAQLILVADVLGLDPRRFDPDGDGGADLVATMESGRAADGSYGALNATAQAAVAQRLLLGTPRDDTRGVLLRAQQRNGGWSYTGDPSGSEEDVDTTARVVAALAGTGDRADGAVDAALRFLAERQRGDGSWEAFGEPDPNSTAMAVIAVRAAGYDPANGCWRANRAAGVPSTGPEAWLRAQQAPDGHIASPNDQFGVNTFATSQAVQALVGAPLPVSGATRRPCPTTGYLVASGTEVVAFGAAPPPLPTGVTPARPLVAVAATNDRGGTWSFASDGGVFTAGNAPFLGSTGDVRLNAPIVAGAPTPTGGGYWLFGSDGGVFTFGDAPFLGSTGHLRLNQPVVGAAPTPSGRGYWLFAADGGVFTFGDAAFRGSTGDLRLNAPVVGGASSTSGAGYWLFAADGGVFTFGDAGFHGSAGALPLRAPVTGGARSEGDGYYLVARDGGVFTYGDAPFRGSAADRPSESPYVAVAAY